MLFHIPKEIASEYKLFRHIYIKDAMFIMVIFVFTWITSNSVNSSYTTLYYIFMTIISIILVQKNQKNNPNKRIYESILILFKRKKLTYHSLDFNVICDESLDE